MKLILRLWEVILMKDKSIPEEEDLTAVEAREESKVIFKSPPLEDDLEDQWVNEGGHI